MYSFKEINSLDKINKKKNLFVTFYSRERHIITYIHNGFSFVKHLLNGDDLFINIKDEESIKKLDNLYNYDNVFFSIFFEEEFKIFRKYYKDNGIAGGPFINTRAINLEKYGYKSINTNFEKFLNIEMSNTFTDYGNDFLEEKGHIGSYSVGLCNVCYGGKCTFCYYVCQDKDKKRTYFERDQIEKIFDSLKYNIFGTASLWIGGDSMPKNILDKILSNSYILKNKNIGKLNLLVRADEFVIPIIKKYKDLQGTIFHIGLESFSQTILDNYLNKGICLETTMNLIKEILKRNGKITLNVMQDYVFMDEKMFEESIYYIEKLKNIQENFNPGKNLSQEQNLIRINNRGFTQWPDKKIPQKYTNYIEKVEPVPGMTIPLGIGYPQKKPKEGGYKLKLMQKENFTILGNPLFYNQNEQEIMEE